MKDVRDWDESDLDRIVQSDQKKITTLDYKASAALLFKDKKPLSGGTGALGEKHRQDMIRDVALMANAEGGLIIYGVVERSGDYPDYIDDGVDRKTVSAEQIDQIILSNINPRVEAPGAAVRHDSCLALWNRGAPLKGPPHPRHDLDSGLNGSLRTSKIASIRQ
jgi:hypothetical protein